MRLGFASKTLDMAKVVDVTPMSVTLYKSLSCKQTCSLLLACFEEVSFHEVSDHVGEALASKNGRWSLGTEESLQQETEAFNLEGARI